MPNPRVIDLRAIAWEAMKKYGFDPYFPEPVMQEINSLELSDLSEKNSNVQDLRHLLWSSIDNHDSMDLDQMEYCEAKPGDEILVRIAIADVDVYVPKQSRTDRHAGHNGTSVYTGVHTFPMLPDKLSKGITSLLPGQDCRALVIEYTVLFDGSVRHEKIFCALVANKAKLIYEEVGDWLDNLAPVPRSVREVEGLEQQIRLQARATLRLKKCRMDQGALNLETIEANAILDQGIVRDLVVQKENMARYLIEEFMIAANGTMVDFLGKAGIPMIQRVVRTPKYWDKIVLTAERLGQRLPKKPDSLALATFLSRQKDAYPDQFPDLSLTIVKLIGPGEYMTLEPGEPPYGHFGLAVADYTHGTAPNRRYVDLIIQRLLKSMLDGMPCPYTIKELNESAIWLTDREKSSKKVERFMRKAAAALLLRDRIGELFDAFVTGASEKGTYVRLIAPPAEGRVIAGERGLFVGQKIRVRLVKTDPYNGFIDFERVGAGNPRFRK